MFELFALTSRDAKPSACTRSCPYSCRVTLAPLCLLTPTCALAIGHLEKKSLNLQNSKKIECVPEHSEQLFFISPTPSHTFPQCHSCTSHLVKLSLPNYRPLRQANVFTPVCHSHHGGGVSASVHAGIHTPWAGTPPRRSLQRTVRILLVCFLVF